MQSVRQPEIHRIPRPARHRAAAASLAACLGLAAVPLTAQGAQLQAFYPLATDLFDLTNTYGPITLVGTPPPSPPNNGVCVNGIYLFNGGQDVRTPMLTSLDTTDFEISVEFEIAGLPASQAPVIMGGNLWRWLGIYLQSNGTVGIKYNNSFLAWSQTVLSPQQWYTGTLKHEAGETQLFIDGVLVLQHTTGALNDGNNKSITTNDFSNALAFNGCIRNLMVFNDTFIFASASAFGSGCAGSTGVPVLAASSLPQLGATFQLAASNLAPGSVLALLAVGISNTGFALGPLPFSLQAIGLGPGCNLLVSADTSLLFGASGSSGTLGIPLPPSPGLTGFRLYFQCGSFDPPATGGITVSNGIEAVLGY